MRGYSEKEISAVGAWLLEGLTAGEIAVEFRRVFPRVLTRNAVIGMVHRHKDLAGIGFARPGKGGRGKGGKDDGGTGVGGGVARPTMASRRKPIRAAASDSGFGQRAPAVVASSDTPVAVVAPVAAPAPKPLADLAWADCRWPMNDAAPGEQHLFCAATRGAGPYCAAHAARARGCEGVGARLADVGAKLWSRAA